MGINQLFEKLKSWSILITLASALAPLTILGYFLYRERDRLLEISWRLNIVPLLLVYSLLLLGMFLAASIWAAIMSSLGSTLPWQFHIRSYVSSQMLKRLPGTVWYIAGRGYLYRQQNESARLVTFASGLEYIITGISGIIVVLFSLIYTLLPISYFQRLALLLVLLIGLSMIHPRIINLMLHRLGNSTTYRGGYLLLLRCIVVYILIWIMGGGMLFLIIYSIAPVSFSIFTYVVGCWSLIGVLSMVLLFLPTNLGFSELGFSYLLSSVVATPVAIIAALLVRGILLVSELISAALIVLIFTRISVQNVGDTHIKSENDSDTPKGVSDKLS